jgi:hypothetical protein
LPGAADAKELPIFAFDLAIGTALVAVVLYDVFETVVVPRRSGQWFRVAPHIARLLWPLWRQIGWRLRPAWRREDFLATFAPFLTILLLMIWGAALVFGFGLLLHALGDQVAPPLTDYGTAFYVAGTALFTIGFGDYVPLGGAARAVSLVAGAAGLAVVALVISLIFNLYSSFARREVLVLLLDARAGVPPSGVVLLETYGRRQIIDELPAMFVRYEIWTAEMLDSHLAYPVLPFFRSSHDGQSWISALGAVLDAATLLLNVVDRRWLATETAGPNCLAAAEMMYSVGCHAMVDLTHGRVVKRQIAAIERQAGIEREEFDEACRRLNAAGFQTLASEACWASFVEHRSVYAVRLNLMASYFSSPPTLWIGDRTMLAARHSDHLPD